MNLLSLYEVADLFFCLFLGKYMDFLAEINVNMRLIPGNCALYIFDRFGDFNVANVRNH